MAFLANANSGSDTDSSMNGEKVQKLIKQLRFSQTKNNNKKKKLCPNAADPKASALHGDTALKNSHARSINVEPNDMCMLLVETMKWLQNF